MSEGPTPRTSRDTMAVVGARIVSAVEGMAEAVDRLRAGLLVAFPTETVYGLGANALDAAAVARIFAAKGRPSTNPLIVHVASAFAARSLAECWPIAARTFAEHFWPGPLTLVVESGSAIPDIVTAGGTTVGLRVPDHPVALELLRQSGLPVAAPSANRTEEVSPTTAAHVAESLGPWVDDLLVLDGGPTRVGIESTVVDVTGDGFQVLRPGFVTEEELSTLNIPCTTQSSDGGPVRSPGQSRRHYAPKAQVVVAPEIPTLGAGEAAMVWRPNRETPSSENIVVMPDRADEYAARLYSTLRMLDAAGYSRIYVESPPTDHGISVALLDRLMRATAEKS